MGVAFALEGEGTSCTFALLRVYLNLTVLTDSWCSMQNEVVISRAYAALFSRYNDDDGSPLNILNGVVLTALGPGRTASKFALLLLV